MVHFKKHLCKLWKEHQNSRLTMTEKKIVKEMYTKKNVFSCALIFQSMTKIKDGKRGYISLF